MAVISPIVSKWAIFDDLVPRFDLMMSNIICFGNQIRPKVCPTNHNQFRAGSSHK